MIDLIALGGGLVINLGVAILGMLLLWMVAVRIRDVSFIDAVWAYGMVGLAWFSVARAGGPAALGAHGIALVALTTLWGVRLGTHLILRWRRLGRDPRYDRILGGAMERKGWSFATAALIMVFLMQGPLLWWVSLPAQAGILERPMAPLNVLGWLGVALALAGILFETVGDAQLEAFRKDPANAGQVMDRGLWRYTRHPNYFGDALTWWGIYLVAADSGTAAWTILSPVFLTWTLMKWSGAALLERGLKKSRPGYDEYIRRTSGFFPLPPKQG